MFYGQEYKSIDTTDYAEREALTELYKERYKKINKELKKKYKGKTRTQILDIYEETQEYFLKSIKKKVFIYDNRFKKYTDSLLTEILNKNPDLSNENIKLLVTRHNTPNAANLGDGTIIINMGLFKYLENEYQLLSVISHEISHQKLQHVSNNIELKVNRSNSKENYSKTKKIKKQKYNRYDKAFSILKNLAYNDSKRYQKQEIEADSLGYLIYKNNSNSAKDYIDALNILIELDTLPSIELKKQTYSTYFSLPDLPFNEKWLTMEDFGSYDYTKYTEKINKDSIKSHPEATKRVNKLKSLYDELNTAIAIKSKNNSFKDLQYIASKEDVANLHYLKNYGLSIYLTLYRLEKRPNDTYYKSWLGKNFSQLYDAKKKYQLNRYVERLAPKDQDKSYQQFLSFIWNLSLSDIEEISNHYNKKGS